MAGNEKVKVFNDPIHGHMEFHPLCVAIIDTPEFQRLRYLKQLGTCYFVYPGACHNRFEHSLGVCHLAGLLVRKLQRDQDELDITEEDVLCVQIAGLCHDLGHGPFSHVFDNSFIPRAMKEQPAEQNGESPPKKWKHEDASMDMFDHMVKNNKGLKALFEKYNLPDEKRKFIKQLIKRPEEKELVYGPKHKKAFLYEIVANERNGVDVDKWDYFKRDSLQLGMTSSFDHMRFISFARVIEHDEEWQICIRDKEAFNMYEMFHTRLSLHRRAYQHRVVRAVEIMLVDALLKYDKYLKEVEKTPLSECIHNMDVYMDLTDAVFHDILRAEDENKYLKMAQDILRNIQSRRLYPCVGESVPFTSPKDKTSDKVEEELLQYAEQFNQQTGNQVMLERTHFVVEFVHLDFGRKHKPGQERPNPVDDIRFYSKSNLQKAVPISASEVSFMIPHQSFEERQVRVFLRPSKNVHDDEKRVELLQDALKEWSQDNKVTKGSPKLYPYKSTESAGDEDEHPSTGACAAETTGKASI